MRTSVLVGAGAVLEIGGPTTDELTDLVVNQTKYTFYDENHPNVTLVKEIHSQLERCMLQTRDKSNFAILPHGFKSAVQKHQQAIYDFLRS